MKGRAFVFFLLLAIPMTGFGQSTLNFPKFFSTAELPNSGFAIVNPGSSSATVNFTLYSTSGAVVATGTQTYGPGTQLARLGNQIFTSLGTGGWVQATSTTTGLQGFWLNYDPTASIYLDGASAATTAVSQVIPLVAGSTQLNIANPNPATTTAQIELIGNDGTALASTVTETLPADGVFQADAFTLFDVAAPSTPVYVQIVSTNSSVPLAATALVKNYLVPLEDAVINGVDESSTAKTLNIPHVVSGPLGGPDYTTVLGVVNLTGANESVTATLYNCGSPQPASTGWSQAACTATAPVQISLAGHGSVAATAQQLFNLSSSAFVDGWIQVTSNGPIAGFAAYADLVGGAFTIVPASATGSSTLMFAHIANLPPWNTGIALLNSSPTSATVTVYAMTPAGTLIGGAATDPATATVQIAPNGKVALGLSQMIPEAGVVSASHPADGGFVFVQSTQPILAIELFYNGSVSILSNVGSASLASGISYLPPGPPQPLTLTSVQPATATAGSNVTLSGTGFSTTAANDSVTFTTSSGTTSDVASSATATSITVAVPANAITGPVAVTVSGQTSSSVILQVLASAASVAQNSIAVSGGTTTNADIYVAPQAGTGTNLLNATEIGVAAVGAGSIPFSEVSATVTHGTTMQVLVYGTGISAANGTQLSFSGAGITVSGVQYGSISGGGVYMVAQITVAASATLGPRDAILTNSNLDISVLSGGLIIQ